MGDLEEPITSVSSSENEAVYHSSGRFTLDPKKALEKLASKALTEPATGSLKLVQAFVRAGCRKLALQVHNQRWVLTPDSDCRLDPNRIAELLQLGGLPDDISAEADLVRALVYLLPARLHSARWGSHLLLGTEGAGTEGQLELQFLNQAPTFPKALWVKRLVHCPMEVVLDGQPLHRRPPGEKRVFLFPNPVSGTTPFAVPDHDCRRWLWNSVAQCWSIQVPPRQRAVLAGWLVAPLSKQAATYPLQAGVMLEPVFHESHPPELLSVVDAEGLPTDLSGLRIVQNSAWRERLDALGVDLHHIGSALQVPTPAAPLAQGRSVASVVGLSLCLALMTLMLILWLMGQIPLAIGAFFFLAMPGLYSLSQWQVDEQPRQNARALAERFHNAKL